MPRVDNLGPAVHEWAQRTGNGSSTHDICGYCYRTTDPTERLDYLKPYGDREPQGDEWAGEPDHPPYEDQYPPYKCAICGDELTEGDN